MRVRLRPLTRAARREPPSASRRQRAAVSEPPALARGGIRALTGQTEPAEYDNLPHSAGRHMPSLT
jgi:hypothetical protein